MSQVEKKLKIIEKINPLMCASVFGFFIIEMSLII